MNSNDTNEETRRFFSCVRNRAESPGNYAVPSASPTLLTHVNITKKRQGVRILIAHLKREEEKLQMQQGCLESLLRERADREEQLKAFSALLPSIEEIESLKMRLHCARERKQKAVSQINIAEECITFSDRSAQERNLMEASRRREYMEVKQSLQKLKAEVIKLRAQMKKLTSDVNKVDVHKGPPEHPLRTKNAVSHRISAADVAKLGETRIVCEKRLQKAHETYTRALRHETEVTQLLARLEKRTRSTARWLESSTCVQDAITASCICADDRLGGDDDDTLVPHGASGDLLGVLVSRGHQARSSSEQTSGTPVDVCNNGKAHCDTGIISFMPMIRAGPPQFSEREALAQDVKQLGARLTRMTQRVGRLRQNLM